MERTMAFYLSQLQSHHNSKDSISSTDWHQWSHTRATIQCRTPLSFGTTMSHGPVRVQHRPKPSATLHPRDIATTRTITRTVPLPLPPMHPLLPSITATIPSRECGDIIPNPRIAATTIMKGLNRWIELPPLHSARPKVRRGEAPYNR